MQTLEEAVFAAADRLMEAFGRHDPPAYFDCFAEDATFLFHTTPYVLPSRSHYEAEWDRWVTDDDFRVLNAVSTDRVVNLYGDIAIFTHSVETTIHIAGTQQVLSERETIVFQKRGRKWVAIHEHLSPAYEG